jgi:hypothetical protein
MISSVAHQLSCFGVGLSLCWFTGGLFLCLAPCLWGKFSNLSAGSCCQHVVMVCWLFFNFAVSFDFGCCSLAHEMSFVDCYLPYFRHRLITHPLLVLLPFQPLFTESSCRDQLLAPPHFSSALTAPRPSAGCSFSVPYLLFSFFFLLGLGCQSVHGGYAGLPQSGCGNIT